MKSKKIVLVQKNSRRPLLNIYPDLFKFKNQTLIIILIVLSVNILAQQDSYRAETQYYIVSNMPSFIGGEKKLISFINKRYIYTKCI